MKALTAVVVSVLGIGVLLYALRDYMPGAMLILGALAAVVAMVARSIKAAPQRGWPTLAAFAGADFLLTGFLTMAGGVQAARLGWLLPVGALFSLGLAIYSAVKWARLGQASASLGGGRGFDTLAQAHELSRAADLDRRRSKARGEMLRAQDGEIQAQQKIRELEAANAALRQKVEALERGLDEAINDPVFDQTSHPLYKHAT
ncbi:bZIP transcription factor [Luteimonas fraxinea]|uniref:bZIP transcription factor n=1 Tax=Luteimonas fraxinea TaxID=2901869 RepID=UPI001E348175|nr:bZIP transcription factor [Luteimonas fraxinea]MCD9125992.1 hypothetical protein [Luteimonas fraxinea]